VLRAAVDQGRDGAAGKVIQAAAFERKADASEILYGRRIIQLAGKPRLDGVPVGRNDIHQMPGLQCADMGCHGLVREVLGAPRQHDLDPARRVDRQRERLP